MQSAGQTSLHSGSSFAPTHSGLYRSLFWKVSPTVLSRPELMSRVAHTMRAMTEWRRRRQTGKFEGGKLMLFFGARSQEELPYFGSLQKPAERFHRYQPCLLAHTGAAQALRAGCLRERAADLATLLSDSNTYFYVCGLKSMEQGMLKALRDVAQQAGLSWDGIGSALKREGRLHLEIY